jgi:hypothetical protein
MLSAPLGKKMIHRLQSQPSGQNMSLVLFQLFSTSDSSFYKFSWFSLQPVGSNQTRTRSKNFDFLTESPKKRKGIKKIFLLLLLQKHDPAKKIKK